MNLFDIYHPDIPDFITELSAVPEMLRLKGIGMDCGCEYTGFPVFQNRPAASRYEHSIGVALIVWHFTHDRIQAIAGLLHDISTPVFAHTVDFMNRDYVKQESTESGTAKIIAHSGQIQALLCKYAASTEEVCDYHRYPVADNDAPGLSADRLEYTLRNLIRYVGKSPETVKRYYDDLIVSANEGGREELAFKTLRTAADFALDALEAAGIYILDEDRFSMESLASLLRRALQRGALSFADLHTTEAQVIARLGSDPLSAAEWADFCALSHIMRADADPGSPGWVSIPAKKRFIDPLAAVPPDGCCAVSAASLSPDGPSTAFKACIPPGDKTGAVKRVSQLSLEVNAAIEAFQRISFAHWIKGVSK